MKRPGTPSGKRSPAKRNAATLESPLAPSLPRSPSIPMLKASKRSDTSASKDGPRLSGPIDGESITVCVRARPYREEPTPGSTDDIWSLDTDTHRIRANERHPMVQKRGSATSTDAYKFNADLLVGPGQTTGDLFEPCIKPVVHAAMDGFNGTVFAFGQTGSGKTHTVMGTEEEPGVIPLAIQDIFEQIQSTSTRKYHLRVSLLEIYNENLRDLLAPDMSKPAELKIREDKARIIVDGLTEQVVSTPAEILALLAKGHAARHTGHTDFNAVSSRSHSVFTITIESRDITDDGVPGKFVRLSQLSLVDLAGSESATSQAERLQEGKHINKSLLTLTLVINKLTDKSSAHVHVPYRDSKLTRLLQMALGGNARVAIICTISPDLRCATESISTLKFARSAKLVQTSAKQGIADGGMSELAKAEARIAQAEARIAELEAERRRTGLERGDSPVAADDTSMIAETRDRLLTEVATLEAQAVELQQRKLAAEKGILTAQSVDAAMAEARSRLPSHRSYGGRLRISDIGLGLGKTRSSSTRSISNHLDAVPTPRHGTLEHEAVLEREIEDLRKNGEATLTEREERIAELEAEKDDLASSLAFAQAELATATKAFDNERLELAESLRLARSACQGLERDLTTARLELEDQTQQARRDVGRMTQQSMAAVEAERSRAEKLTVKVATMEADLATTTERSEDLARRMADAESERDAALAAATNNHDGLQAALRQAQQELRTCQRELEEHRTRLQAAEEGMAASTAARQASDRQYSDKHAQAERLASKLATMTAEMNSLRLIATQGDDRLGLELKQFETQLAKSRADLDTTRAKLEAAKSAEYATAAENADTQKRLAQMTDVKDQAEERAEELAAQVGSLERLVAEAEAQASALADAEEKKERRWKASTGELQDQVNSLRQVEQDQRRQLSNLTQQHSLLDRKHVEVQRQLSDASDVNDQLRAENVKLKAPKLYQPNLPSDAALAAGPTAESLMARVAALKGHRDHGLSNSLDSSPRHRHSSVDAQCARLAADLGNRDATIRSQQSELATLRDENAGLRERNAAMEADLFAGRSDMARFAEQSAALLEWIDTLRHENVSLPPMPERLQRQLHGRTDAAVLAPSRSRLQDTMTPEPTRTPTGSKWSLSSGTKSVGRGRPGPLPIPGDWTPTSSPGKRKVTVEKEMQLLQRASTVGRQKSALLRTEANQGKKRAC